MRFIIHCTNASGDDSQLGGKAKTLAALSQQVDSIPDWFVISPTAFEHCLNEIRLDETQQTALASEIISALDELNLSEAVENELTAALAALCPAGEMVAVRSSALEEDGSLHSFAGQFDSFLFVPIEQVAEKILAVWKSGFSDRLLSYRQEHQLTSGPTVPAVLIQKMINPEVAGVAFSAHPVTGDRDIAVISAAYGLGNSLVSGDCNADSYEVDRNGVILKQQIVDKLAACWSNRSDISRQSDRIIATSGSDESACQPALNPDQIQSIARLVRRIEQLLGCPQDIEWAIERDKLYLLQARPITALFNRPDPTGMMRLWDNSNIAESYGGVTTPLTFSFTRRAYAAVYRQFCRLMSVPESTINEHDPTFRQMLGLLQGRIYYNLLSWYKVLALLPGFTINRHFMEQMMGIQEELSSDIVQQIEAASWQHQLQDSLRLVRTLMGLLRNHLTLLQQIQQFYQRLDHALSLHANQLETMEPDQLIAYYDQLEQQLLTRWDAPLVNDFFAMIFYGLLRKLTKKWCNDAVGTLQNALISGEGGMVSAEPAQRVQRMAKTASVNPAFVQCLCEASLERILNEMHIVPAFVQQYQDYLEKFSDRCLEELKLESPTLQDNPLLLLRSVGQLAQIYLNKNKQNQQNHLIDIRNENERDSKSTTFNQHSLLRQQAEQQVKQHLADRPLRRLIFNWILHHARSRVRDRENLRFERTRVFGRVRRIMVELGRRFHALNLLSSPQDIFYLELDEILGFVNGTATCTDLKGLISVRQAEFAAYSHAATPADRFTTYGMVHPLSWQNSTVKDIYSPKNGVDSDEARDDIRQGTGCCPGIVRASVQVVIDPRGVVLKQGCILVSERTDPGWIMLFPAAAGLLVERGSLLSHAAIVAREMGLPAIVALAGVTQWLQDGDWIEMDGNSGIVRRICKGEQSKGELPFAPSRNLI